MPDPPADPSAVALTVCQRGPAWDAPRTQRWHANADAEGECDERVRHVGDITAWLAWPDPVRVDPLPVELGFVLQTAFEASTGRLNPELDELIGSPTADRTSAVLIITECELAPPWRGMDLAGLMMSATVERFRSWARLAACRISPAQFGGGRAEAETAAARAGAILERYGWQRWRGLHVIDTQSDALVDATLGVMMRGDPR
ncbi:hypothetical protein [Jiangella alkaliphila]|nr:hypothetical protein [Jiangella alkaliphila]